MQIRTYFSPLALTLNLTSHDKWQKDLVVFFCSPLRSLPACLLDT